MNQPPQQTQAPRYFIQIPTNISGLGLNTTDKYIYGQIYTMLNVCGVCYMSNAKLAEPAEVTTRSASRSVSKLAEVGLIKVKLTYKEGTKQVDKRYITLNEEFTPHDKYDYTPHDKNVHTPTTNMTIPHDKYGEVNRLFNRLFNIYKESRKSINFNDSAFSEFNNNQYLSYLIDKQSYLGNDVFNIVLDHTLKKNYKRDDFNKLLDKLAKQNATDVKTAKEALGISVKYTDNNSYMILANELLSYIRRNDSKFKTPNLQTWADDFRKLVELDNRPVMEVKKVIKWTQKDSFWRGNILSPRKLRKQYSKLLIQSHKSRRVIETLPDWAKEKPVTTQEESEKRWGKVSKEQTDEVEGIISDIHSPKEPKKKHPSKEEILARLDNLRKRNKEG